MPSPSDPSLYLPKNSLSKSKLKIKSEMEIHGELCSLGSAIQGVQVTSDQKGRPNVKFEAHNKFTCLCKICKMHGSNDMECDNQESKISPLLYSDPKDAKSFPMLLEYLVQPMQDIEPCSFLITDTFFINEEGKPYLFVRTDRDGKIVQP